MKFRSFLVGWLGHVSNALSRAIGKGEYVYEIEKPTTILAQMIAVDVLQADVLREDPQTNAGSLVTERFKLTWERTRQNMVSKEALSLLKSDAKQICKSMGLPKNEYSASELFFRDWSRDMLFKALKKFPMHYYEIQIEIFSGDVLFSEKEKDIIKVAISKRLEILEKEAASQKMTDVQNAAVSAIENWMRLPETKAISGGEGGGLP